MTKEIEEAYRDSIQQCFKTTKTRPSGNFTPEGKVFCLDKQNCFSGMRLLLSLSYDIWF